MATHKEHCADCMEQLGQTYSEVHTFLDSHFAEFGHAHRAILHHTYGILMVKRLFGPQAAIAAEIHIRRDCDGIIPTPEDWLDGEELTLLSTLARSGAIPQKVNE